MFVKRLLTESLSYRGRTTQREKQKAFDLLESPILKQNPDYNSIKSRILGDVTGVN